MTATVSAVALARMRALQNLTFDLTATITRPSAGVDDGEGGKLAGTPTTTTSVCRLAPHRADKGEEVIGNAIQGTMIWDITFPALTDIRLKDRVTISGLSYEVVSRYAPKSRETARAVLCVER